MLKTSLTGQKIGELLLSPGPFATLEVGDILYFIGDDLCLANAKQFLQV